MMPPGAMPGVPPPGHRNKGGRPTLLTDELTARIAKHIDEAAFFETACVLEGIPAQTGREWLLRGKKAIRNGNAHLKSEAPYARFSAAIAEALARFEKLGTAAILAHGKKDWKATAWVMKAKFPNHFGSQAQTVVVDTEERQLEDGTVEETTTVATSTPRGEPLDADLTDDDYAEAAAFLLRRKRLKQATARGPGGPENA
jgi:hypothetical protein